MEQQERTIQHLCQVQESLLRQLLLQEERCEKLAQKLLEQKRRLDALEAGLWDREARVAAREAEAKRSEDESFRAGSAAREQLTRAQQIEANNARRDEELTRQAQKTEADRREADARMERARLQQEASDRLDAEVKARQSENDRRLAEARRLEDLAQRTQEVIDSLRRQLWPSCLVGGEWSAWREKIEGRSAGADVAGVLLARLHTLAAIERMGKDQPFDLLREIGRLVYECGEEECVIAGLCEALNRIGSGRFRLKLVKVGDDVDRTMNRVGTSTTDLKVREVKSWVVMDRDGNVRCPAEIC
jgi:hypothetical protein